jgi:hypothetical protein
MDHTLCSLDGWAERNLLFLLVLVADRDCVRQRRRHHDHHRSLVDSTSNTLRNSRVE